VTCRSLPSFVLLVANLAKAQAVPRFLHAENIPIDFWSEKVWMSFGGMPSFVGTGTTPQLIFEP